jgi:hypothetical protein
MLTYYIYIVPGMSVRFTKPAIPEAICKNQKGGKKIVKKVLKKKLKFNEKKPEGFAKDF